MILTETVKVKWEKSNKKIYVNKGYIFTNYGDEFEIKIEDLTVNSDKLIDLKCDGCGKVLDPIIWKNYKRQERQDGKYYCRCCKNKYRSEKEMIGEKFGKLTVIKLDKDRMKKEKDGNKKPYQAYWLCKCDCGNSELTSVRTSHLKDGSVQSCGCESNKIEDLTGQIFGRLTVIKEGKRDKKNRVSWLCKCNCGNPNLINVKASYLKDGKVKSCGCLQIETRKSKEKHKKRVEKLKVIRLGEENKNHQELDMYISNYIKSDNIEVTFKCDNSKVKTRYRDFFIGKITHPKLKVVLHEPNWVKNNIFLNTLDMYKMMKIRKHGDLLLRIENIKYILKANNINKTDEYFKEWYYYDSKAKKIQCYYITLDGVKLIADQTDKAKQKKELINYLNSHNYSKEKLGLNLKRMEEVFINDLDIVLKNKNIKLQTQVYVFGKKYRIDGYIEYKNIKLAIEYDEQYHRTKKQSSKDIQRQKEISDFFKCEFIRLDYKNDNKYNIKLVLEKINELINQKEGDCY